MTETFVFRLKPEDKKLLQKKASEKGLSSSAYLRLLIRERPAEYPEILHELQKTRNEVSRIGNNINQITKAQNAGLYSFNDKIELNKSMNRLVELMSLITKRLMSPENSKSNKKGD